MYDRYVEQTETSTLHRMKETYWTTKQAVIKKLGKKEDEHVVASDSQLDSKLEVSEVCTQCQGCIESPNREPTLGYQHGTHQEQHFHSMAVG